ncbi:MAG TPA: YbjN domain-containing protein [Parachlamydiaceae bacterium]|nr:YbjN domain-containing protein [Parachlamydiaceae bacterium]
MKKKNKQTTNLENLMAYFQTQGFEPVLQETQGQLQMQIKIEKVEFPFFAKVREDGSIIQLLAYFPCNIKEGAEADTARSLHLLNKEIDIPGFGMDDLNSLIFYRCMVPCANSAFDPAVMERFSKAIPAICHSFFPMIFAVSQGKTKYAEIASQYETMLDDNEEENAEETAKT